MKQLLKNYTFNPATKQIDLIVTGLALEQVLLITNTTTNTIIYNFASQGGTLAGSVLTLDYDTSLMSATDNLQIYIDIEETPNSVSFTWAGGNPLQKVTTYQNKTVTTDYTWVAGELTNITNTVA